MRSLFLGTRCVLLVSCLLLSGNTVQARARVRRATSNTTTVGVGIAESCHEKRNPCAESLSCLRSPSLFGLIVPRRVCFPKDCLFEAIKTFNDAVNVTAYNQAILAAANVTPAEFFMLDEMRGKGLFGRYRVAKEMQNSNAVHRVMDEIRKNPIPQDQWSAYETDLAACDPQNKLSTPQRSFLPGLRQAGPTTQGVTGLVGFGLQAGAGLGGGVEFFFGFPHGDPFFFIDLGGGLLFGVDAGVGGFIGMAFTGTQADIPGLGFELELQIPTPVVGPGFSIGVDLNPVWDIAISVSAGAGIGVGGFSVGYTWGFPETTTNSSDSNLTRI